MEKQDELEQEVIVKPNPSGGWRIEFPRSSRPDYPPSRQRGVFVVVMLDKEQALRCATSLGQQANIRIIQD